MKEYIKKVKEQLYCNASVEYKKMISLSIIQMNKSMPI